MASDRWLAAAVETVLAGAWRADSPIHGDEHWRCVVATGLDLADLSDGCDRALVLLFGVFHDTRRVNESIDPDHGPRAAVWAREVSDTERWPLAEPRLRLLCDAVAGHTRGLVSEDATVAACWDADRLHLPRVGIDPDPARFSTVRASTPDALAAAAAWRAAPPRWDQLVQRVGA